LVKIDEGRKKHKSKMPTEKFEPVSLKTETLRKNSLSCKKIESKSALTREIGSYDSSKVVLVQKKA